MTDEAHSAQEELAEYGNKRVLARTIVMEWILENLAPFPPDLLHRFQSDQELAALAAHDPELGALCRRYLRDMVANNRRALHPAK